MYFESSVQERVEKNIWLICEKRDEARDNGYHFYKYLREEHSDVNAFYVIKKGASDYRKVKEYRNIIYADSFKHGIYYLAARYSISSQAYGAYPFRLNLKGLHAVKWMKNPEQKTIFLQHGIIKDELSHEAFDYSKAGIDYFVCSAPKEYEFVKNLYGYPDQNIGCIGLCRFDQLHNAHISAKKQILVMPTWRMSLKRAKDGVSLTKFEIEKFQSSCFYKNYTALLSNTMLIEHLRQSGTQMVFYLHYQLQDYTPSFDCYANDVVRIADRFQDDVQELLLSSRALVTDYSSVYFDFAYLNRPLIYYQFDYNDFLSKHYAKGYFDYATDGFGPCVQQTTEVVQELIWLINHDFSQREMYQRRTESFFLQRDGRACERTYNAIMQR